MTDYVPIPSPSRRDLLRLGLGAALALPMLSACDDRDNDVPASYRYDITEAAKIDPSLITWREVAAHDLNQLEAVDVQPVGDDRLAVLRGSVVDWLDTSTWTLTETWSLPEKATAMAARDGGILIAFYDRIERWVEGQAVATNVELGEPTHITSIAVDGQDTYLADAGRRQVLRYRGSDEVWRIDGYAVPSPYFDVAVHDGKLWVANTGKHKLQRYDESGTLIESFGKTGMGIDAFCGCCNPCHFIVLRDGRFVTAEKGLHRVKVLKPDGSLDGVVAGAEQLGIDINSPICMNPDCSGPAGPIPAALSGGRLAVIHPVTGKVHVFDEIVGSADSS